MWRGGIKCGGVELNVEGLSEIWRGGVKCGWVELNVEGWS